MVKVYSTPNCPWCAKVKEFLKENNIDFENIDVSEDIESAREMVAKSGQMGVPVIDVKDNIIVGFNEPKLRELLSLK